METKHAKFLSLRKPKYFEACLYYLSYGGCRFRYSLLPDSISQRKINTYSIFILFSKFTFVRCFIWVGKLISLINRR